VSGASGGKDRSGDVALLVIEGGEEMESDRRVRGGGEDRLGLVDGLSEGEGGDGMGLSDALPVELRSARPPGTFIKDC
jgi:hypothetical protein